MTEQALAASEPALVQPKRGRPPKVEAAEQTEEKFPVRLIRNYVPRGDFEVVGYHKEAVTVKDATGRWYEVEPAIFMHGERKPHPSPGVGFDNKLWAGTYIAVSRDEARDMIAKKIAERADDV